MTWRRGRGKENTLVLLQPLVASSDGVRQQAGGGSSQAKPAQCRSHAAAHMMDCPPRDKWLHQFETRWTTSKRTFQPKFKLHPFPAKKREMWLQEPRRHRDDVQTPHTKAVSWSSWRFQWSPSLQLVGANFDKVRSQVFPLEIWRELHSLLFVYVCLLSRLVVSHRLWLLLVKKKLCVVRRRNIMRYFYLKWT